MMLFFHFRLLNILLFILLGGLFWSTMGHASSRKALIVGNAEYQSVSPLENTIADAKAYGEVLQELEYEVTLLQNLDRLSFDLGFADFIDNVQLGDTVVFVFSGHGWSDGSTNFILPVDIQMSNSSSRVKAMSTPLQNGVNGIIDQLRAAGASTQIAIVDACRNNIFAAQGTKSLGMTRGLAVERAPQGAFLIFSAGSGEESLDRLPDDPPEQRLSVFTRNFLPKLRRGMYLEDAINEAQLETATAARRFNGHMQNPAYYDQINGKLCLSETCTNGEPLAPRQESTAPFPIVKSACDQAQAVWADVKAASELSVLKAFERSYEECAVYASLARAQIISLTEVPAPKRPKSKPYPILNGAICARGGASVSGASVCVSSVLSPQSGNSYGPNNLLDESRSTAWVEGRSGNGEGEKIRISFDQSTEVKSLSLVNGYGKSAKVFSANTRPKTIRVSAEDGFEATYALSDHFDWQKIVFDRVLDTHWLLIEVVSVVEGSRWQDSALSEISVQTSQKGLAVTTEGVLRGRPIGPWLLILGSYPESEEVKALSRRDALRRAGYAAAAIATQDYPNLKDGLLVVAIPFATNWEAKDHLTQLLDLVPDAYIKNGG